MATDKQFRAVADWLTSCETRFQNMYNAGLDENGYPAIRKALDNFNEKGYLTVGEIQYLFNRSHPEGALPKYNTHKGLHKKMGNMLPCPLKDLIDCNIVDWSTGRNGVIQPALVKAIANETGWEYRLGNLRAKYNSSYTDLFDTK